MVWMLTLGIIIIWNPTILNISSESQAYQISQKPCWVDDIEGTCMFVWECIKSDGYHIGMCVDAFMFGSCCAHDPGKNVVLPNYKPNQPSVLYTPPSHNFNKKSPLIRPASSLVNKPTSILSSEIAVTKRPEVFSTTPHFVGLSSFGSHHTSSSTDFNVENIILNQDVITSKSNFTQNLITMESKPNPQWKVTTEPTFLTRIKSKPTINNPKEKPTKKPIINFSSKIPIKFSHKTSTTFKPKKTTISISPTKAPTMPTKKVHTSTFSNNITTGLGNMDCGIPELFVKPQMRIVGGRNAPFGRWPWQVSVRRTSFFGFSSTHRCGGAVLNENWVATAGHCVDDLLTSQIRIRAGEYDFSNVKEDLPYEERSVLRKIVHPKYNFFTYEYDLALVQLDKKLKLGPHIAPICLPASDDLLIGENATVTGWGRLSEGGPLPSVLQEVQVPILSNDLCKSMFLKAGRQEFIPEIFLCAGHETGGMDSCQGDSGGPLQVKGKDGRFFLAGIISWGIGCAEANLPGVCTRISKFVPWIMKNVT